MGLFDVTGLGEATQLEPIKIQQTEKTFKPNDFDKEVTQDVDPLVKYEVINRRFNLGKLLRSYGCDIDGQQMYCPFHMDKLTGKPSAKYHSDTDRLYCFSESKSYTAYHALKILFNQDMSKVFDKVWALYSLDEKREILENFSTGGGDSSQMLSPIWEQYKPLLDKFQKGEITYRQFKAGMYKVFVMISDSESTVNSSNV